MRTRFAAIAFAAIAFALAACAHTRLSSSPAASSRASGPVLPVQGALRLREGIVSFVVEPDGAWARFQDEHARRFLVSAEDYLDVSLGRAAAQMFHGMPTPWTIRVRGQEAVYVGDLRIGAYNNLSGWAGPDRGVFVEFRLSKDDDAALVLHELGHFWFKDPGAALLAKGTAPHGIPWFNEGIASYFPLAVAEAGFSGLTPDEERAIRKHWGQWWSIPPEVDAPLERDLRHEGKLRAFYAKTFKVQLLLRHELGRVGYRALLSRAAKVPPRSVDDVLALLEATRPLDWRAVLTGWVFEGAYAKGYTQADVLKF